MKPLNWLIVVAGGNGERMKLGFNKIFAKIRDLPLIYWTLKIFEESGMIDHIIISAKKNDISEIKKIIKKNQFKKIKGIIEANHSRQDSTFLVLKKWQTKMKKSDLVGVHNAVNPFVTKMEIEQVYLHAKKHKAALLAYPAKDTVKITNGDGLVDKTPLRQYCWYAQTPQVAKFSHLWQAFLKADQDQFVGTDDTQLLERIGIQSKIVPCSNQNIKITYPEDLLLAEHIVRLFYR